MYYPTILEVLMITSGIFHVGTTSCLFIQDIAKAFMTLIACMGHAGLSEKTFWSSVYDHTASTSYSI